MTPEELAADIDALIVIARHEGIADAQVIAVLRAALEEMLPATKVMRSAIVRPRKAPKPRPQPALAVPVVVWRPKLRRWRRRIVATEAR
jgi:hypothetical protein